MRMLSSPVALVAALAPTLSAFALLLSATPAANAQANLAFSGGSGSPLNLTILTPITYNITVNSGGSAGLNFLFDGVGGAIFGFQSANSGNLRYSVNGGTAKPFAGMRNGFASTNVTNDDIYIQPLASPDVVVGDVITLFPGTLTTDGNVATARPADGSYQTFIFTPPGVRVSSFGVAGTVVPEANTLALVMPALGMVGAVVIRRRKGA